MAIPKDVVFGPEEFEGRRRRVREAMAKRGIDTLVIHSAPNIYYLSGHHTMNLWDYQCLVLPSAGEPFMVLWQFERGCFEMTAGPCGVDYYDTGADFVAETKASLARRGLIKGTIGLEDNSRYLTPQLHAKLTAAFAPAKVVGCSTVVELVRVVKSEAELALMRRAAAITDDAIEAAFAAIRDGVTDSHVCAVAARTLIEADSLAFSVHPMVCSGYKSGMPHNGNNGRTIRTGETVFLEWSPSLHWYHAPIMRTAVVGPPAPKVADFAKRAAATVEDMLAVAKAGVAASAVAEAGKKRVSEIRKEILFHDVYGYPIGIGFPPTWAEESGFGLMVNNHRPLETNMVFHIPMTHRLFGEWGVGLSQSIVIKEKGCEVLSRTPLALRVVG
jgi:Xaa-Pro aminopeptidase